MPKSINEMTLAELESALRLKIKRASELQLERDAIVARLQELDDILASMDGVPPEKRKAPTKRISVKSANPPSPPQPVATSKSATEQIMDFLIGADGAVSSHEIRQALPEVAPGYLSILLNQLLRAGMVTRNDGKWTAA